MKRSNLSRGDKPLKKSKLAAVSPDNDYMLWCDQVARPYLDATFGHRCAATWKHDCNAYLGLDVDHILERSTHPELIQSLENVQYLCRRAHQFKTSGKLGGAT